ncbi:FUSC family protein [uncultured Vibrio sp.]|uniref:FUSC family protein n=1 Tax=uncultured Vibrio sp. TaxID=114054 RepID=UPI00262A1BF4|nr:FUSC family protein [uncultured Vibrio sp.]
MFSASTKEAIKVALSIVIALCLALWFEWEKPYWAAIAVSVMALNESFAHSLNKGHNRLLGTLLGVSYAFFLVAMFSQERFLFLTFLTAFLAVCIFMSSDEKYGYAFSIGFIVCCIITCMGGFDSANTFQYAVIRLQETILGVAVFSFVFRLLWPADSEQKFLGYFESSRTALIKAMQNPDTIDSEALANNALTINKLKQLLNLPLSGSYHLKQHIKAWRLRVQEMAHLQDKLAQHTSGDLQQTEDWPDLIDRMENFNVLTPSQPLLDDNERINLNLDRHATWHKERRTFVQHLNEDGRKVIQGVSMFVTSLLIWIYLPVPGGFIFPMIAGVMSSLLPTMPPSAIKHAFFGTIGTGTAILLEYVFVMPMMSELWQLALFYFVNVIIIWKVFSAPNLMIHRVLGINLLVVLTSGALNLTPAYTVVVPILMLINLLVVLMIAKIFTDLFRTRVIF